MMSIRSKQTVLTLGLLAALGINASWSPLSTSGEQVAHLSSGASGPHASNKLTAQPVEEGEPEAATGYDKIKPAATATTTPKTPKAAENTDVKPPLRATPKPKEKPAVPAPTPSQNAAAPAPVDPAVKPALTQMDSSTGKPEPLTEADKIADAHLLSEEPEQKPAASPVVTAAAPAPQAQTTSAKQNACNDQEIRVLDPSTNKSIALRMHCEGESAAIYTTEKMQGNAFPLKDNGELCVSCLPTGTQAVVVNAKDANALTEVANALIAEMMKKKVEPAPVVAEKKSSSKPCHQMSDKMEKFECFKSELELFVSEKTSNELNTLTDRERRDAISKALNGENKNFPGLKGLKAAMRSLKEAASEAKTEEEASQLAELAEGLVSALKDVKTTYSVSVGENLLLAQNAKDGANASKAFIIADAKLAETKNSLERDTMNLKLQEAKVDACWANARSNSNRGRNSEYECSTQEFLLMQKQTMLQNQAAQKLWNAYSSTTGDLNRLMMGMDMNMRAEIMPRVNDVISNFSTSMTEAYTGTHLASFENTRGGNSRLGRNGTAVQRTGSGRFNSADVVNRGGRADIIQTSDGTYRRIDGGANVNAPSGVRERMNARDVRARALGI